MQSTVVVSNGLNGAPIPLHKTSRPQSQAGSLAGMHAGSLTGLT